MNADRATHAGGQKGSRPMRIPGQAGPVVRNPPWRLAGRANGVTPSSTPCYRGNTCDLEDFLGLVDTCNQCLALCGHSIGDVGDCARCEGPLPKHCLRQRASPMLYMWNDGFCTQYRGRCPSLEACCGLGAVSVSTDPAGMVCDVC
jgi:hypothetical protein